jgi:hypothetical protein
MTKSSDGEDTIVAVPARLARRIRLALDHADRDAATSASSYHDLAGELVECAGYPIWQEPWSESSDQEDAE